MDQISISENCIKAFHHFSEGFRILSNMTACEYIQENSTNITRKATKTPDLHDKKAGILYDGEKLVLSVSEVGKLLGLSRSTTYELICTSQIPSVKFGRRILVPREKLETMLF